MSRFSKTYREVGIFQNSISNVGILPNFSRNKGKCCMGGHSLIKGKMGSLGRQCLVFKNLWGDGYFSK